MERGREERKGGRISKYTVGVITWLHDMSVKGSRPNMYWCEGNLEVL